MRNLFLSFLIFLTFCAVGARGQATAAATADTTALKQTVGGLPGARCTDDVTLYPNPAPGNELNIVYDQSADIKNIAVYNLIGKIVAVYKVTGNNSANLSLETLTPGIYFVRLFNSQGEVVLAKRFTRQ
jgi:hypothetical protein